MQESIFSTTNQDLQLLADTEAVAIFRKLLWAEARKNGIPISKIRVSDRIDVSDGGIDAIVEANSAQFKDDLIKNGTTSYQIKASSAFLPTQQAKIRKELFGDKQPDIANLNSQIKECLDNNGTYVLVCFKQDLGEREHQKVITNLTGFFQTCGYQDPKIEVWSQNNLRGFINQFPGIVLEVKKLFHLNFLSHQQWADQREMDRELEAGVTQEQFIAKINEALQQDNEPVQIHVVGEPGIGKTRLVLEATRAPNLAPLVIYFDSPEKFISDFMTTIIRDESMFAIVVVDECDPNKRTYIYNYLHNKWSRIKIITIYNEYDDFRGKILEAPPLDIQKISNIIQSYEVAESEALNRWGPMCDGSPRVAHVIGSNLQSNPDDVLKSSGTVRIWDRYIAGEKQLDDPEVQKTNRVLKFLALFKRFGYGHPMTDEARSIAAIIEKRSGGIITWDIFNEIVQKLVARKILQGKTTLYITPKALHIKLWGEWWDTYGNGFNLEVFYQELNEPLVSWFNEMFIYAAQSQMAQRVVKELLGTNGPFKDSEYLKTKMGANFFRYLAEADPEEALKCLNRTIRNWSRQELLNFKLGRRDIIWALEKILIWRDLFVEAAQLVLILGEAENETWSNNASGVFARLFSLGYGGRIAPTKAPPSERFPVLEDALLSDSKQKRTLALAAIRRALETRHFSREISSDYQGLKPAPDTWMPETWEELFDAYRQVWELLAGRLDLLRENEREEALSILLDHTPALGGVTELSKMVLETLEKLILNPDVDKNNILTAVSRTLLFEGKNLSTEIREDWEKLKLRLTPQDFPSLLKRYIGPTQIQDHYDENGNYIDNTEQRLEELAKQGIADTSLLLSEFDWLIASDDYKTSIFGYLVGKNDTNFSLLSNILETLKKEQQIVGIYFVGGYFRALNERDPEKWEVSLENLSKESKSLSILAELTSRSGFSEKAIIRVLELAKMGLIGPQDLYTFRHSKLESLSEKVFRSIIDFLLTKSDTSSIYAALVLFDYYHNPKFNHKISKTKALKLLSHPALFNKKTQPIKDSYVWIDLANKVFIAYPDSGLKIIEIIFRHFGERDIPFEVNSEGIHELLNHITYTYPEQVWNIVSKYLNLPIREINYYLTEWLRGTRFFTKPNNGLGGVNYLPIENIWKWIDANIEERAWYFATFVPKDLTADKEKLSIVREFLKRYGDREDVRRNLFANYGTESWMGPRSLHLRIKKEELSKIADGETEKNVKRWLKEYISYLDESIKFSEIEEEREAF